MDSFVVDRDRGREALLGALDVFVSWSQGLTDEDLLQASDCLGWAVLDVVTHVRIGLDEMLRGIASPTEASPTHDAASYWLAQAPAPADGALAGDGVDGVLWTRRTSSAYRRPTAAVQHLVDTAAAVRRAVETGEERAVEFQGCVLSSGCFWATWAVEVVIHHLDAQRELSGPLPGAGSLYLARCTIEALAGAAFPAEWADLEVIRIGAGRRPAKDQAVLERLGITIPVLG